MPAQNGTLQNTFAQNFQAPINIAGTTRPFLAHEKYFDDVNIKWRPFKDIAEAHNWSTPKLGSGGYRIINVGGTLNLNTGMFTGGTETLYGYVGGIDKGSLVPIKIAVDGTQLMAGNITLLPSTSQPSINLRDGVGTIKYLDLGLPTTSTSTATLVEQRVSVPFDSFVFNPALPDKNYADPLTSDFFCMINNTVVGDKGKLTLVNPNGYSILFNAIQTEQNYPLGLTLLAYEHKQDTGNGQDGLAITCLNPV